MNIQRRKNLISYTINLMYGKILSINFFAEINYKNSNSVRVNVALHSCATENRLSCYVQKFLFCIEYMTPHLNCGCDPCSESVLLGNITLSSINPFYVIGTSLHSAFRFTQTHTHTHT